MGPRLHGIRAVAGSSDVSCYVQVTAPSTTAASNFEVRSCGATLAEHLDSVNLASDSTCSDGVSGDCFTVASQVATSAKPLVIGTTTAGASCHLTRRFRCEGSVAHKFFVRWYDTTATHTAHVSCTAGAAPTVTTDGTQFLKADGPLYVSVADNVADTAELFVGSASSSMHLVVHFGGAEKSFVARWQSADSGTTAEQQIGYVDCSGAAGVRVSVSSGFTADDGMIGQMPVGTD